MKYVKNEKAENLYRMLHPYRMARKEECPAKVSLVLMINRWINPWHALQDLEKVIPFNVRKKIIEENV